MNQFLIFLSFSFFLYSCEKQYAEPQGIATEYPLSPKKVIYTHNDRKETTEFSYYPANPNHYPSEKLKLAHKVISWPGQPDTIIDLKYTYIDDYPGYLATLTTTITTATGSETFTEHYTYFGTMLQAYYHEKTNLEYRFYWNFNQKIDYVLTGTNDSLDVIHTDDVTTLVKFEPYDNSKYIFITHRGNNVALADSTDLNAPDNNFFQFEYNGYTHPMPEEVWNAFGPMPDKWKLVELLTYNKSMPFLPFAVRYASSIPPSGYDFHYRYGYVKDEFGRVKTINVYPGGPIPVPISLPGIHPAYINQYHNYSLYYY